ncbi:hypothetical protein SEVIR_1G178050v4 [Setaria viridis]
MMMTKEKGIGRKSRFCPGCPPACPSPGPTLQWPARFGIRRRARILTCPPPLTFLPPSPLPSSPPSGLLVHHHHHRIAASFVARLASSPPRPPEHPLLSAAAFRRLRRPSSRLAAPALLLSRPRRTSPSADPAGGVPLCAGPAARGQQWSGGPPCRPLRGASTRHDLLAELHTGSWRFVTHYWGEHTHGKKERKKERERKISMV